MAQQPESSSAASATSPGLPRRKRRWLRWLGGIVLLVMVLIALLPTLVTLGLANGYIRSTINKSINGNVVIGKISVGWFSGQSVQGLTITDPQGDKAVDLNVQVDSGLLKLIASRGAPMQVTLSGTISGKMRKDGSISFEDLIVKDSKSGVPKPREPTTRPGEPFKMPGIPPVTVNLNNLSLNWVNEKSNQTLALNQLNGKIAYSGPTQPIVIDLHGQTNTNGTPGSVDISGQAGGLFDRRGQLALAGAVADVTVKAQAIPLPLAELPTQVQSFTAKIKSDDLTRNIVMNLEGDAQVDGHQPSHLKADMAFSNVLSAAGKPGLKGGSAHITIEGQSIPIVGSDVKGSVKTLKATLVSDDLVESLKVSVEGDAQVEGHEPGTLRAMLTIAQPFDAGGTPTIDAARMTGNVTARALPTALLQRFLSDTPIVATRDIGPTLKVDAGFSEGSERDVTIMAVGEMARLEIRANVNQNDQSINGKHLLLTTPAADPALVMGLANLKIDRPTDVEILLTSFRLPPIDSVTKERPKTQYAATGSLRVKGPTVVELPGANPQKFNVEGAVINIESPALKDYLKVDGSAIVEGAGVTIAERITNLFDSSGKIDVMNSLPVGTIEVKKLPGAMIAKFAPADQVDLINALVGESLSATVKTDATDGKNLRAAINATAALLTADTTVTRKPDALHVGELKASLTVTPQLAAMLQKGSAQPIQLTQQSAATVELKPFALPATGANEYGLPAEPIKATITVEDIIADKVPRLAESVGLSKISADVTAQMDPATKQPTNATIAGTVQVRRTSVDKPVTLMRYDLQLASRDGSLAPSKGTLDLKSVSMKHLEALLGYEKGGISQWAGDKGALTVNFDSPAKDDYTATINTQLPNLAGDFIAALKNEMVSLNAKTSTLTLTKAALENRLNAPVPKDATAAQKKAAAASRMTVDSDVPLSLAISQFQFPLAMIQNKPFDPKAVDIAVSLGGGPVIITTPDGIKTALADLDLKLNTKSLNQGVAFSLTSKAKAAGAADEKLRKAGTIDVQGKIVDLVSQDNTLHTETGKLQLVANVNNVPTMIADAFTKMDGLLVAALGQQMNAKFDADDFSGNSGTLDARIDTTNGFLEAFVKGKDESLRSNKNKPINAELKLTEPLRKRLLEKVHPILADIRTTKQPIRANINKAIIPTDGDVSRLSADIEITIGEVEFDSGSTTLKIMSLFSESAREVIPGNIEPIKAKIRNGVLTYDAFNVHIDKNTMVFKGQVDLVKRYVDLHWTLPLSALSVAIPQLEGKADKIIVPLVTRGEFGKVKTSVDPDFNIAKAALEAGLKDPLDDLLKGKGGGNLLDDLLSNPKKKP